MKSKATVSIKKGELMISEEMFVGNQLRVETQNYNTFGKETGYVKVVKFNPELTELITNRIIRLHGFISVRTEIKGFFKRLLRKE